MSGNFTQRGEPAVMDKYTRAKHAIIAGADIVIELPTIFATANAEIFAKGAINIIDGLKDIDGICFGVESGEKQEYLAIAKALLEESKEFKKALKENLDNGLSFAKARYNALEQTNNNLNLCLLSSPNNVLGIEYVKALLTLNSTIEIYPMIREGDHNDPTLKKGITSATSIREVIKTGKIKKLKKNLPKWTYQDITEYPFIFDKLIMASIVKKDSEQLSKILDCTEGLENRIKAFSKDNHTVNALIEKVLTKRYTRTRIQRILISALLDIDKKLIEGALDSNTYAKVLAIASDTGKDLISTLSKSSVIPLLTRKSDCANLKKWDEKCFSIDIKACELYSLATGVTQNENQMIIV